MDIAKLQPLNRGNTLPRTSLSLFAISGTPSKKHISPESPPCHKLESDLDQLISQWSEEKMQEKKIKEEILTDCSGSESPIKNKKKLNCNGSFTQNSAELTKKTKSEAISAKDIHSEQSPHEKKHSNANKTPKKKKDRDNTESSNLQETPTKRKRSCEPQHPNVANGETSKKKKKKDKGNDSGSGELATWFESDFQSTPSSQIDDIIEPTQDALKCKKKKKTKPQRNEENLANKITNKIIETSHSAQENSTSKSLLMDSDEHSLLAMLMSKEKEMTINQERVIKQRKPSKKRLIENAREAFGNFQEHSPNNRLASLGFEEDMDVEKIKGASLFYRTLTNQQINRLDNLRITLPFIVPPLQTIETRITINPTKEQRERIDQLGVPIKEGLFLKLEDDKIRKNWQSFCELHDIPEDPRPFIYLRGMGAKLPWQERIKFAQYLAWGLEERLLFSVYKRFKVLMGGLHKGRFTPVEDKFILDYVGKSTSIRPFSVLGPILNRDSQSVERRFKTLTSKAPKIEWNDENLRRLLQMILKVTKCTDKKELEHREITRKEWEKIGRKMGNIPAWKVRRRFYYRLYPGMFVPSDISNRTFKYKLVHMLIENQEDDWKGVPWKQIAKHFPGFSSQRLLSLLHDFVKRRVPKDKWTDLGESLKYLKKEVLDKHTVVETYMKKF